MNTPSLPLADRWIGVPESRQLDLFANMLEVRGARVCRCPLMTIRDAPDPEPIQAWVTDVIEHGLDDMIWLTGEGVQRLERFVEAHQKTGATLFWNQIRTARHVTRGPKPVRALKPLGIDNSLPASAPTTSGVIETLRSQALGGHRVGVQLYGDEPNVPLMQALADQAATALPVAPYVYADGADDEAVAKFIQMLIAHDLDAIAFTSSQQVKRLFRVAARQDCEADLRQALAGICVAAVGPLVAESLTDRRVGVDLMPESNYFMKPLVRALVAYWHPPRRTD